MKLVEPRQDRTSSIETKVFFSTPPTIPTYGKRELTLDIGLHRKFRWSFLVADVNQPILVADFLRHFRVLVDIANSCLFDTATSLTVPTQISILIPLHLNNRLLDEFSNEFDNIFSKIPSVCEPCITESNVKHTVQEHIITTGAPFFLRNWASPLHMVPMSNGHSCPYGEYCAVNAVTKPARYPIAHVQDFSNHLARGTIFSNIDLV